MLSCRMNLSVCCFWLCTKVGQQVYTAELKHRGVPNQPLTIPGRRPIIENFSENKMSLTSAMFEALLFMYTFGLATYLSHFRRTPWLLRPIRNLMANFAVTISLVTASALAAIYSSDTNLRMLSVDADFSPNLVLSDGSKRPWVVNPMGIERSFPAWAIAYAILPAT